MAEAKAFLNAHLYVGVTSSKVFLKERETAGKAVYLWRSTSAALFILL